MKKSFLIAATISFLLAGFIYYSLKGISVSTSIDVGGSSIDLPESDTAFGGLFYTPFINDSTPHYLYKRINDSIQDVKKSLTFESNRNVTSGLEVGFVGAFKLKQNKQHKLFKILIDSLDRLENLKSTLKDSTKLKAIQLRIDTLKAGFNNNQKEEETPISYCISLRNYKTEENTKFFIQNEAYYLAPVIWDSANIGSNKNLMHGRYVRKQIPVLYSENRKKVYIPVTKTAYNIIIVALNVWFFLLLFYSILVLLVLPIFILIAISNGRVFTRRNILGLKIIAYSLLLFAVIKISEPFILHSIFKARIPTELQRMSFREILNDSLPFVVIAIIVFLILKAFQKGYNLQQDQDLTV
jgi:Protein of unknown function (DUF2975)